MAYISVCLFYASFLFLHIQTPFKEPYVKNRHHWLTVYFNKNSFIFSTEKSHKPAPVVHWELTIQNAVYCFHFARLLYWQRDLLFLLHFCFAKNARMFFPFKSYRTLQVDALWKSPACCIFDALFKTAPKTQLAIEPDRTYIKNTPRVGFLDHMSMFHRCMLGVKQPEKRIKIFFFFFN